MMKNINKYILSVIFALVCVIASAKDAPRIVNIVNFVRQTDYRLENSDSLLYDCVMKQVELLNRYGFPATFLFQYDSLINPLYSELMTTQVGANVEIGAWWEITQPHVEAAGLKWRGDHSWVSAACIAFSPGYTHAERERLVDVYMAKFKEMYGYYPKSVGSWYIDSYTLQYMQERYGIDASCNCKDQVGTDGYTLWGGYWNQAYYPSKLNGYMPAQNKQNQIDVPMFRMLGSDPIYQYERGVGTKYQSVVSLEPVYKDGGGDSKWVDYYFDSMVNEPCGAFAYTQVGQENSFTWDAMAAGLEMQFAKLDSLNREGKVCIETLGDSGRRFKRDFAHTPATAVVATHDENNSGNKAVWYDSRYYRASVLCDETGLCIRDIHVFDELMRSAYYDTPGTGNAFYYYTLPMVDRYHWSTADNKIGMRIVDAQGHPMALTDWNVSEPAKGCLRLEAHDSDGHRVVMDFAEKEITVKSDGEWSMECGVAAERTDRLPFTSVEKRALKGCFEGHNYEIKIKKGEFEKRNGCAYAIKPNKGAIKIIM